ncbi:hypothetical protein BD626DRAFT_421021, partial [Schizophyllum amplum]
MNIHSDYFSFTAALLTACEFLFLFASITFAFPFFPLDFSTAIRPAPALSNTAPFTYTFHSLHQFISPNTPPHPSLPAPPHARSFHESLIFSTCRSLSTFAVQIVRSHRPSCDFILTLCSSADARRSVVPTTPTTVRQNELQSRRRTPSAGPSTLYRPPPPTIPRFIYTPPHLLRSVYPNHPGQQPFAPPHLLQSAYPNHPGQHPFADAEHARAQQRATSHEQRQNTPPARRLPHPHSVMPAPPTPQASANSLQLDTRLPPSLRHQAQQRRQHNNDQNSSPPHLSAQPFRPHRPHRTPPLPPGRRPYREVDVPYISFGSMDRECPHCRATHWTAERTKTTGSSDTSPKFARCCMHGKIQLPLAPPPPARLYRLFTAQDARGREFRQNIRQYNAALSFTSLGVHVDDSVNRTAGPYVFKIGGQLHHHVGSLMPAEGIPPRYAQLYVYDPRDALRERMTRNDNLRADTMSALQHILLLFHPYSRIYRQAYDVLSLYSHVRDISLTLCVETQTDARCYNLPTADELAAILPGNNARATEGRDIIVHLRSGRLRRVNESSPAYACLHYVLFFP